MLASIYHVSREAEGCPGVAMNIRSRIRTDIVPRRGDVISFGTDFHTDDHKQKWVVSHIEWNLQAVGKAEEVLLVIWVEDAAPKSLLRPFLDNV